MLARLAITVLALATLGTSAHGQEASASIRETRCWIGDVAFSAGMAIGLGEGAAVCEAGVGWQEETAGVAIAGCLLEGKLSSVGAVLGIRNNDSLLLQCDASGRWVTIEPGA